ncbi:MAG: NADH-quinone oxidoreductase subunit L, partial [Deltaproteobacteria bacterium]|nr:NADH-quinone oxidoreductase subunit L [Deltaproteobacteria bacterium]
LLFLGAGSVIHALGGEQDITKMGGLKERMPITCWTFVIASAAIAGIFPFAGFFSKDAILWHTFHGGHISLWLIAFLGAGLTAFYMFRLVGMVFFGEPVMKAAQWMKVHESPPSMASVLMILAVLSAVGGWIGIPYALGGGDHLQEWLAPVFAKTVGVIEIGSHATEIVMAVLSLLWALHFVILAWVIYAQRKEWPARMAGRLRLLYRLVFNKYWIDEIYNFLIVRPLIWTSEKFLWGIMDVRLIDQFGVHGTGRMMLVWNRLVTLMQTGVVQQYLFFFVVGVILIIWGMLFK